MAKGLNPWKIQGYKPGQNVICKIMKSEPGGYAVIIPKDNLPGYLPTDVRHNVGEEVLVTYVCVDKNRMLLAERYGKTAPTKGAPVRQQVDWSQHLDELDDMSTSHQAIDPNQYQSGNYQHQQQYDHLQVAGSGPQTSPFAPPSQYDQSYDQFAQPTQQPQDDGQYMTGPLPSQMPSNQYLTGPLPSKTNYNQFATGPLPSQSQPPKPIPPHLQQQQPEQYQQPQQNQQQQQQQFQNQPPQYWQPPAQFEAQYDSGAQQAQQYSTSAQPTQQQYASGAQPAQQHLTGAQPAQRYAEGMPTTRFRLQRAIDLIMPPVEQDSLKSLRIGDYDVEWLITDLEGGMRTGCVKAACESRLSRAAMLLYKGRAVGCIYGCKSDLTTKPTEESLQLMLADLESPDTMVTLYDLPEEITLAMSSLFLGYPVERHDDYNAQDYLDYICNWLGEKNGTATLAISLSGNRGTCLGYIYKGRFSGAFYVEDQLYRAEREYVNDLLRNDPQAGLEVSILPPEMHTSAVRFGFSLSMARTRRLE